MSIFGFDDIYRISEHYVRKWSSCTGDMTFCTGNMTFCLWMLKLEGHSFSTFIIMHIDFVLNVHFGHWFSCLQAKKNGGMI